MTNLKPILLSTLMLSVPALGFAGIGVGDNLGTSREAITAALEAQGYEVLEIEIEGDEIEVEVLDNGVETEFEVSPDGTILSVELDDDREDDDDDDDDHGDDHDDDGEGDDHDDDSEGDNEDDD